jgi:hypothetical protein
MSGIWPDLLSKKSDYNVYIVPPINVLFKIWRINQSLGRFIIENQTRFAYSSVTSFLDS